MTILKFLLLPQLIFLGVALLNIFAWPRLRRKEYGGEAGVSVLIPARNEELNLPACLDVILMQGPAVSEVIVYNDHSTDGTARVIESYLKRNNAVRALIPEPLPSGWCGKNFACDRLARAAKGDFLLYIDADARLKEGAINAMVDEMRRRQLKFLSCWPGLDMESISEKAVMPSLNFVVFSIFPAPLSLSFNFPSLGIAHGACLMFERKSYFEIGGHAAVRDQIFEDVRLAQLCRSKDALGLCLDGQDIVRVRMYSSLKDIWHGFEKNFYPAFRNQISFWAFILFQFLVFLLPFFLMIFAPSIRIAFAIFLILLTRLSLAAYFRHPLWSALLHPFSQLFLIAIGFSSWWKCKTGNGVEWRGRQYLMKEKIAKHAK